MNIFCVNSIVRTPLLVIFAVNISGFSILVSLISISAKNYSVFSF